jgi:hypothetical protein
MIVLAFAGGILAGIAVTVWVAFGWSRHRGTGAPSQP